MTAIQPGEIQFYLSNPNAGTGYSGIGQPGNSRGKFMSTSQVSGVPLDNVFLDLTGPQNAGGQIDYQCVFMYNGTTSGNYMHAPYVWLPLQLFTSGGASINVGMDPIGPVPYTSSSAQAQLIASNTSAPSGVTTWVSPNSVYTLGLLVPDLPPTYCVALWLQRTANDTAPLTPQTFSLTCTFATNA